MQYDPNIAVAAARGLAETAAALTKFNIPYALIGGIAVSFRSQPRFTKDIDLLLQIPEQTLHPLLEDLQLRGFTFDLTATIREWNRQYTAVMWLDGIRVDWLKPAVPAYQHILERATEETFGNQTIRVASLEGIILLKLLAFRPQDQIDLENLIAAAEGKLDLEWIRSEWQTIAGLDDPRIRRLDEMIG